MFFNFFRMFLCSSEIFTDSRKIFGKSLLRAFHPGGKNVGNWRKMPRGWWCWPRSYPPGIIQSAHDKDSRQVWNVSWRLAGDWSLCSFLRICRLHSGAVNRNNRPVSQPSINTAGIHIELSKVHVHSYFLHEINTFLFEVIRECSDYRSKAELWLIFRHTALHFLEIPPSIPAEMRLVWRKICSESALFG